MNKSNSILAVNIEGCLGANQFIKGKKQLDESQSPEQNIDYQIPMCSKHTNTLLSLYDVDLRERKCPKCVIYCEDRTTYINCRFIEIDQTNKVQNVLSNEVEKLQHMIKNIEQGLLKKAQDSKAQVEKSVIEKLKRQYEKQLNQLNSYYESEKLKNLKQIDQAWQNQICQILKFVQKVKLQLINMPKSSGTKLDKVSESIICQDECKKMGNKLIQNVPLFESKLAELQKSVNWVAKVQFINIEKEYEKIQFISKSRNIEAFAEDELLIDLSSPSRKCSQTETLVVNEKLLEDCKTDRTNVTNMSIEQDKISLKSSKTLSTSGMSRISAIGSKSQLVIQNIGEINKIDTQIREISAKNLAITNTDAKKVLELVSKSFVKMLDLSGNKISSIFVKDLTKAHVGKYLKTIKLNGNNIDTKDPAVFKKIEQLKSQGVSILL